MRHGLAHIFVPTPTRGTKLINEEDRKRLGHKSYAEAECFVSFRQGTPCTTVSQLQFATVTHSPKRNKPSRTYA